MSPKVSINVCCYNSEKYLEATLQSVFAQTFKDWELVIVNDGCTDQTDAIVQRHIAEGWPIVYHQQQNAGIARARNQALALSKGDYVALLDHDDLYLSDTLEKQVRHIEAEAADLSYGGLIVIDAAGRERRRFSTFHKTGWIFPDLLRQFDIWPTGTVIRRAALLKANLTFDPNVVGSEEYCLFMQLAVQSRFAVLRDMIALYRSHQGSFSDKVIGKWASDREYTLNLIRQRHPGIEEKYKSAFREAYARAHYYRARELLHKGCRREAISELRKAVPAGGKYVALFLILTSSTTLWHMVHRWSRSYRY